jgi:5-amino-6-(5-phospho-D-ribitylamino)uracil phosphatase
MQQKYFLTDLDGTLLRSNASLSKYTIDIVKRAINLGAVISYATARSYIASQEVVSEIPWKYPLVLYNGALLVDPLKKTLLGGNWLAPDITNEIIQLGKSFELTPLLFSLDQNNRERVLHEKLTRVGDKQFYRDRPNDTRFQEVGALYCPETYRTLTITYIGHSDELAALKDEVAAAFGNQLHVHFMKDSYIKDHYFLEFSHPQANKQEGLRLWAECVGCQPDEVTVFGDNLNDIGMFHAAGRRIAVANAHKQILEMADEVARPNDEDGVAAYISKVLLKDEK